MITRIRSCVIAIVVEPIEDSWAGAKSQVSKPPDFGKLR